MFVGSEGGVKECRCALMVSLTETAEARSTLDVSRGEMMEDRGMQGDGHFTHVLLADASSFVTITNSFVIVSN